MNLDSIPGELDAIKRRLNEGDQKMQHIERLIAENTEVTKEIRDLMVAGRLLRRLIVWGTPIVGAIAALLVYIRQYTPKV